MTITGIVMDNVMISGSDTVTGSDVNIDDVANNVVNGLDVAFAIVIDDGVELSSVLHCT